MAHPLRCVWAAFDKRPRSVNLASDLSDWLDRDVPRSVVIAMRVYRDCPEKERLAAVVSEWCDDEQNVGQAAELADSERVQVLLEGERAPTFEWYTVMELLEMADDVYVGREIDHDAAEAVWQMDGNTFVVKNKRPAQFEALGWKRLSEVTT